MINITFNNIFKSLSQDKVNSFRRLISTKSDTIEIHTHKFPDKDAITSMMMLALVLNRAGKEARIVVDNTTRIEQIEYRGVTWRFYNDEAKNNKTIVVLDTIPSRSTYSGKPNLIIDHHTIHNTYTSFKLDNSAIVIPSLSTGQLIYNLMKISDMMLKLNDDDRNILKILTRVSVLGDVPYLRKTDFNTKEVNILFEYLDAILNTNTAIRPAILKSYQHKNWYILIVEPNHETGYLANDMCNNSCHNNIILSRVDGWVKFSIRTLYNNYQVALEIENYLKAKNIKAEFGAHYAGIGGRIEISSKVVDTFLDIIDRIENITLLKQIIV